MLGHSPFKTLFQQKHDGGFELKSYTSSPLDEDTRDIASEMGYEFDPTQEAKPRDATVIDILKEIRDLLRDMRPNPPADNFRPIAIDLLDTTGSEQTLIITNGWEYVYVPPVPRAVTVYWGNTNWPLAILSPGQAAKLHIPFRMDTVRVAWGAGTLHDVIYAIFTTDPIDIDILAY